MFARWPWSVAVGVLALDAALLAGLAAEGSVLARPGGARYVLAPLAGLVVYAAALAVTAATFRARLALAIAVRVGAIAGVLTGAMWIASLTIETFAGLSGWPNIAATAPLLLGAFAIWGTAGAVASGRSDSIAAGTLAAVGGAMLCVAITIGFGFALDVLALPTLESKINGSPEYLASHWGNLHAFAIANTLDAAATHLLLAPIIATLTGTLGGLTAARSRAGSATRSVWRRRPRAS